MSGKAGNPAAARAAIAAWFDQAGDLPVERVGESGWFTVLSGERKRTIPVYLEVGDRTLVLQSFFVRAPDEAAGEVAQLLLRRHLRSYVLRFATTDDGDVLVVAVLPLAAVTTDEIDRLLGQLLELVDGTFEAVLRLGFASYIEREQAWRASLGLPRNPIT
ncbi:MAG TPA: YbjN domain-containing protein [Egibacteraceae bacterium]